MEAVLPMNGFMGLTEDDLMMIDGGAWSTHDLGVWMGTTAAAGAVGGATLGGAAGSVVPYAGTLAGVGIGGAAGFVGGALIGGIAYCAFGWW
ncbi:hypothetical protein EDC21_1119 [Thermohydrogenium kirishiense]|nr:hypothetical protein EDC21_1119 [Thermohydrogenium kirishiense]